MLITTREEERKCAEVAYNEFVNHFNTENVIWVEEEYIDRIINEEEEKRITLVNSLSRDMEYGSLRRCSRVYDSEQLQRFLKHYYKIPVSLFNTTKKGIISLEAKSVKEVLESNDLQSEEFLRKYLDMMSCKNAVSTFNSLKDGKYSNKFVEKTIHEGDSLEEIKNEMKEWGALEGAIYLYTLEENKISNDPLIKYYRLNQHDYDKHKERNEIGYYSYYCPIVKQKVLEENKGLLPIKFSTRLIENKRVSTRNANIIGLPKKHKMMICAPKGYVLFHGDFGQADLVNAYNLYLRNDELDHLVGDVDDWYRVYNKIVCKTMGLTFNEERYQEGRAEQKPVTLGPIYNKKTAGTPAQQEFVDGMNEFLAGSKKYQKYLSILKSKKELKLPIVIESFLGHKRIVNDGYDGATGKKINKVNIGLNAPPQTFTSENIIILDKHIHKKFQELGLQIGRDFRVYYYRYDEALFLLREDLLDEYGWVFGNYDQIRIDGLYPMTIEWHACRSYEKEDEELTRRFEESCERHRHLFQTEKDIVCHDKHLDYLPVKDVLVVHANVFKIPHTEEYVVSYISRNKRGSYEYIVDKLEDISEFDLDIMEFIADKADKIKSCGYDTVLVHTNLCSSDEAYTEGVSTIIKHEMTTEQSIAIQCAKVFAYLYATREGLLHPSKYKEGEYDGFEGVFDHNIITPKANSMKKIEALS